MRFSRFLAFAAESTTSSSGLHKLPPAIPPIGQLHLRRDALAERSRKLARKLKQANTSINQLLRLDDLCRHLIDYPETRSLLVKVRLIFFCVEYIEMS